MGTYKIGQIINIGYNGGFHNQTLIKTKAEITKISGHWIDIKVYLKNGGFRKMFGYDYQLKELERNYNL